MRNDIEMLVEEEVMTWQPYIATQVLISIVVNFGEEMLREMFEEVNEFMNNDDYKYQIGIINEDKEPTQNES